MCKAGRRRGCEGFGLREAGITLNNLTGSMVSNVAYDPLVLVPARASTLLLSELFGVGDADRLSAPRLEGMGNSILSTHPELTFPDLFIFLGTRRPTACRGISRTGTSAGLLLPPTLPIPEGTCTGEIISMVLPFPMPKS